MRRSLAFVTLSICCSLAIPRGAAADSVTITNGTAVVPPGGIPPQLRFNVSGDGFTADGSWDFGMSVPQSVCSPGCSPGQMLALSTTVSNDSLLDASAGELGAAARITVGGVTVNGANGGIVELLGSASFTTAPVTLPSAGSASGVTVSAPFTLTGIVQGYNPFARDPNLLFTAAVNGSGTAFLSMASSPNGTLSLPTIRYEFSPVAPTPEPATMALTIGGLAFLLALRRLRTA